MNMNEIKHETGSAVVRYVEENGEGMSFTMNFPIMDKEVAGGIKISLIDSWEKQKVAMAAEGIDVDGPYGNIIYSLFSHLCIADMKRHDGEKQKTPMWGIASHVSLMVDSPYWVGDWNMMTGEISVQPMTKEEFDRYTIKNLPHDEQDKIAKELEQEYKDFLSRMRGMSVEGQKEAIQSTEYRDLDFRMRQINMGIKPVRGVMLKAPVYVEWVYDVDEDSMYGDKVVEGPPDAKSKIRQHFVEFEKQFVADYKRPPVPPFLLGFKGPEGIKDNPKKIKKWMRDNAQLVSDITLIWNAFYWNNHHHHPFKTKGVTQAQIGALLSGRLAAIRFNTITNEVYVVIDEKDIQFTK